MPAFRLDEVTRYDDERGELQTLQDGVLQEVVRVRQTLMDSVALAAIVLELERRGYTVTPPDGAL